MGAATPNEAESTNGSVKRRSSAEPTAATLLSRCSSETTGVPQEDDSGASSVTCNSAESISGPGTEFDAYTKAHPEAKCVVGIDGHWYDVTSFRFRHPGGAILLGLCHGKDATELFKAFHSRNVLKGWRPIASYTPVLTKRHPAVTIFRDLQDALQREGYFETSYTWYARKIAATFLLLVASVLVLVVPQQPTWVSALVGGVLLGMFWQQCGFLMHDLMHSELTHKYWIDRWIGLLFGSFFLGVSAHWWRDEHFEHHAFCNVVDKETLYVDPQMQEDVWVQSPKLFRLYTDRGSLVANWVQLQFIRFQHVLWIPLSVVAGRLAIIVNGIFKERRWYEVLAQVLHTCCMALFLGTLIPPGYRHLRVLTYMTAAIYEGILHMQLLVSHYAKPWVDMDDVLTTMCWGELQVKTNLNIRNPWFLDWFHGGLNFHIEHHLYPLMPRHNFREVSTRVRQACEDAGLDYDECSLSEAIIRTVKNLATIAQLYVEEYGRQEQQKTKKVQ